MGSAKKKLVAAKSQSSNTTTATKKKKLKKSSSPNPKPNSSSTKKKNFLNNTTNSNGDSTKNDAITPTQVDSNTVAAIINTQLPPPSTITPSSSIRRSNRSKNSPQAEQEIATSPLTLKSDRMAAQSSPIRATKINSLPSPSPDHPTKSSPIKSKKVMFDNENLVTYTKLATLPTPSKSILKATQTTRPPQMNPLIPNNPIDSAVDSDINPTSNGMLNPSTIEFWTPGNIPRLSNPSASQNEELGFFKNIIHGGIVVLDSPNCDRQFEIYATFNLLFKENLTDKKILILLGYLPELIQLLRKDITSIENDIMTTETSNPFLVRTDIQITKILTQLISNIKLINTFWKKSKQNFEYVKWCINHSASVILNPTVSKSLMTANLQLVKDHKLHSYLNVQTQEFILYALLNMKYFNSSSLLIERLYTLKSLIINHTLMMEKNAKTWLPFLFNCLCDFNSPIYQKQQQVATQVLLECSKLYISSRNVNFEIKRIASSPIHKTLQIAPDTQVSLNSSPLDLSQTTLNYISTCIEDTLADQCKSSMDLWLGLTILLYNDSQSLSEFLEHGDRWYAIVKSCLKLEDKENKLHGIRAYKGLIYVLAKNIKVYDSSIRDAKVLDKLEIEKRLKMMFKVFECVGDQGMDTEPLFNLSLQIMYALFNNPTLETELTRMIWPFIDSCLKFLAKRSYIVDKICVRVFSHLVHVQEQPNEGFYLIKCVGEEKLSVTELAPLSADSLFKLHDLIFQSFLDLVVSSKAELLSLKVNVLSNILSKLKLSAHKEGDLNHSSRIFNIIQRYQEFLPSYFQELKDLPKEVQLEYINKLVLYLKANFGYRLFYKVVDDQLVYNDDNIFVTIIRETLKETTVKPTDVLKFIMNHIKVVQYKFYESLLLKCKDPTILQYVSNNLESKIFEKALPTSEIQSIANTISHLPMKPKQLLENYTSYISKSNTVNGIGFFTLNTWSIEDLATLYTMIHKKYPSLEKSLYESLETSLKTMKTPMAIELFTQWLKNNEFWLLNKFSGHIYYHIMDPSCQFPESVHTDSVNFLIGYLKFIKDQHFGYLDYFVHHGFILCEAVKRDENCKTRINKIEKVFRDCLNDDDVEKLEQVKEWFGDHPEVETQNDDAEVIVAEETSMSEGIDHTVIVEEANLNAHSSTQIIAETQQESAEVSKEPMSSQQTTTTTSFSETQAVQSTEDQIEIDATKIVQASSSIELTADVDEGNSSDHEFYDAYEAQTNVASSPSNPADDSDASNSSDDNDTIQTISRELVEPTNQVAETQEISDSNEDISKTTKPDEHIKELIDEEKEKEVPSDSVEIFSSPFKSTRKLVPLSSIHDSPPLNSIELTPIPQLSVLPIPASPHEFEYVKPAPQIDTQSDENRKQNNEESSDDDDLIQIDNEEFHHNVERASSSPRKRTVSPIGDTSSSPNKKRHHENVKSSVIDILTPPDESIISTPSPIEQVTKVLNGFTDETINNMDDQEVYEMENRLLAFVMKMRNRQRS